MRDDPVEEVSRVSESSLPYKYQPEIEELAFACYIQADRNVSRAHRMLLELCPEEEYLPDRSTIGRWARNRAWDAKADEAISLDYPNLLRRDLARVQILRGQALSEQSAIFAGERDHLAGHQLMARTTGIATVLQISGLGTAGSRSDERQLAPAPVIAALEEGLSPQERARRQRERLEAEQAG
jgi:hypothetical protein